MSEGFERFLHKLTAFHFISIILPIILLVSGLINFNGAAAGDVIFCIVGWYYMLQFMTWILCKHTISIFFVFSALFWLLIFGAYMLRSRQIIWEKAFVKIFLINVIPDILMSIFISVFCGTFLFF